ncbi:hypothetical protein E5288_WYG015996 [Bos mutus]|uniref:Large ribosomal subunit protein uL23 N-terminal domain-containing protein n=1 Tax=Bos mutus TaxID=72004 RepID=A0A6B0RL27_9CETA|nr:hypothetical protein [Bos mutus]
MSPTFRLPETLRLRRQPSYPWKSGPRRNKLDPCAIIRFPLTTKSAMKKTELTVDGNANKHQIKQATKLCDTDVAEVNNLVRPEREKKPYVPLAPGHDASDVADKIGII